jgi:hypothetical protein
MIPSLPERGRAMVVVDQILRIQLHASSHTYLNAVGSWSSTNISRSVVSRIPQLNSLSNTVEEAQRMFECPSKRTPLTMKVTSEFFPSCMRVCTSECASECVRECVRACRQECVRECTQERECVRKSACESVHARERESARERVHEREGERERERERERESECTRKRA